VTRAFIVGNGPSLNNTNLDLLIGETSFGVNRISGIYPKTRWRPTHYVRAEEASIGSDPRVYSSDIQLHKELGCEIWANEYFIGHLNEVRLSGLYRQIRGCSHYNIHFDNPDCPPLYHMPRLCTFGSSVHVAIQIALGILNVDTVYLVGADLGYKEGQPNHFDANYTKGAGKLRDARYTELDIIAAHLVAARSYPGRIYNATAGGSLEVYPRVSLVSLFESYRTNSTQVRKNETHER
jgi:hypothetical protein